MVLFAITLVNYWLGRQVSARPGHSAPRAWLWLGILFKVGAILHFKNVNFYLPELLARSAALALAVAAIVIVAGLSPSGAAPFVYQGF